jgi:hypothetical protein
MLQRLACRATPQPPHMHSLAAASVRLTLHIASRPWRFALYEGDFRLKTGAGERPQADSDGALDD